MFTGAHCAPSTASWQAAETFKNFVEVGVIACERFLVHVEQFIAGCHDECCSELGGAAPQTALTVPANERSRTRKPCVRPDQRGGTNVVHLDDIRSNAFFVQKDVEGHGFVLDERLRVFGITGAYGCYPRSGGCGLLISISNLTGSLAAGQSTEVPQKEEQVAIVGPQVT